MQNLYQQTNLKDHLAQIMQGRQEDNPGQEQLEEAFLTHIVKKAYQSLQETLGEVGNHAIPVLNLYPFNHPKEAKTSPFVDQNGLHFGLGFLYDLDIAVWIYTNFLLRNYLWQISPLMGDAPPLSEVVSASDFPQEALTMHAASLIPGAISRDGYVRRPFQAIMEFFQNVSFSPGSPENPPPTFSRWLDKPPFDLRHYLDQLDHEDLSSSYLDERGAHMLNLHCQMLLDAVYFLLTHEVAHYLLSHHKYIPENPQSREEEALADLKALEILDAIPGFKVRSLLTLFSFCHLKEPEIPPEQLSHPFSRNRVLILVDTILKNRYDEHLRADINAGMNLMTLPLPPIDVRFGWDENEEEDFTVMPFYYSDSDYCAHLLLYLDRPPHNIEFHDGGHQNIFLLSCLTLDLDIVLRDRIHPDRVFYRGKVKIQPRMKERNIFHDYKEETIMTRMDLRIPCLPEWWLQHPESEVAIDNLDAKFELDNDPSQDLNPLIKFFLDPVEIDYDAYLQSLPTYQEDPFIWANLLLAARRFHEWCQPERAIHFYHYLYSKNVDLLGYPDLIDLAYDLVQLDQPSNAAAIADYALSGDKPMRPGFNLIIAYNLFEQQQIPKAFEHAFLEMLGIGKFGEFFDQSNKLFEELASHQEDPVMERLQRFRFHFKAGQDKKSQEEDNLAIEEFRLALQALQETHQLVEDNFVFLQEFTAETLMEICILENSSHQAVREAFKKVLEIEPRFVPAYIQMARLALLEGDRESAHDFWKEANDLMPFNHFVFEFREAVEQYNPEFSFESRPVKEMFNGLEPEP